MNTILGFVSILFTGAIGEIALKLIGASAIVFIGKYQISRNIASRHELIRLAEIGKEIELKSGTSQSYLLDILELANIADEENLSVGDLKEIVKAFADNVTRNKKTGAITSVKWQDLANDLGFKDSFASQIVGSYGKIAEYHYSKKGNKAKAD